ncbi:MAG TPA: hypothetical protein VGB95_01695 [Chitinophagales bacterium]
MIKANRMARKKKSEEEVQNENEFLKMSLMAEFGGEFIDNSDLPAEVENRFLKEIQKFHRLQTNADVQKIYDLLGRPEYDHANDVSDKEIRKKIAEFQDALLKLQIIVTTLSKVNDREFYRFITEEVFKTEAMQMNSRNFTMNIIYEDFYPSEEASVKISCLSACNVIFNYGMAAFPYMFSEEMKNKIGLSIDIDELVEAIEKFQAQYNQMEQLDSSASHVEIAGNQAAAKAFVEYKTQTEKGKRFKKQQASLEFQLEKQNDSQWLVTQVVCDELSV